MNITGKRCVTAVAFYMLGFSFPIQVSFLEGFLASYSASCDNPNAVVIDANNCIPNPTVPIEREGVVELTTSTLTSAQPEETQLNNSYIAMLIEDVRRLIQMLIRYFD